MQKKFNFAKALFLVALLLPFKALSAEITAIDFSGNVIGQVISTGMVINPDGENIGTITADSMIVNDNGAIIGGVVPQGIAIGMDNRFLGKVHSDGLVRSLSGRTMGKVLPNGLVVDEASNVIAAVLFPGIIYSPNGDAVGRLTGGGEYTKLEGQRIGFVSANGYAYRKSGDEYVLDGRLMSSKMVVSVSGKFLGSIAPSGSIIDFEGKEIGKIHANGYAYDATDKIIGSVIATGYAFDQIGKYIGIVSYNGEVKRGGQVVANYRADGSLVRSNGDVVGFAVSIAATANDNNGNYLGYVVPNGNIVRGNAVVGRIGAKGYVYDSENKQIGMLVKTGPVYDSLARLSGQSMRNGKVISLGGNNIGYSLGAYVFDANGKLIGGLSDGMIAVNNNLASLGMSNIDSTVSANSSRAKISPFGYLFNSESKIIGSGFKIGAIYGIDGLPYSYISPNGELYRQSADSKLTPSGILQGKDGYIGSMLNPLYALDFAGNNLGTYTNSNILLNSVGAVAYKIIPADYAVSISDATSQNMAPITGFAGANLIALNVGGDLIGYAMHSGAVNNLNGNQIGHLVENEYVVDNNEAVIGKLIPFAPVINEKCSVIGVVNGSGDVVNNRDVIIGRLLANGQAISDVGSYIGYAVFENALVDENGNFAGTVSSGSGMNINGKNIGCVNREGIIVNDTKKQLYGTVKRGTVIDFSGKIIGNVLANGNIADNGSKIIGYTQPNGNVISKSGKNLGNIMRYQVAYTNNNRFLGMVRSSGQVIADGGQVAGQVLFDGSVERDGKIIGYALYDFYVYDENFVTYGYLTKDGTVLSPVGSRLGKLDRGFVLDKSDNVVARGNRDYLVRNAEHLAVGTLQLDGTVIDFEGVNVGYLAENGIINNSKGEQIALATPYQYYTFKQAEPEVEEPAQKPRPRVVETAPEVQVVRKEAPQNIPNIGRRVIGIAINPDGDIIGNIYDDDTVRDSEGNIIGYKTPDGRIVDKNYNEIGTAELKKASAGNIFMPPNAYGKGNPYGIGEKPSNVGAGGGYGQGERYDPVRAQALQQMQAMRRNGMPMGQIKPLASRNPNYSPSSFTGYEEDGWPGQGKVISSWRVDMSEMILEDKGIPAVLARSVYASQALSNNIPVTAIVERNVYAEEGRNVIIPAGSRVIGKLSSGEGANGNSGGAVKIGITWHRLIRPDGSQFTFSNAQTADAQGRSGAIGYLDQQLLKKYTMPMLTTALQTVANYLMADGSSSTSTTNSNGTTTTQSARSQALEDGRDQFNDRMKKILDEIMQEKAKIRSVTYVPAGTRIIIYPNQDLWLNSRERDRKARQGGKYEDDKGDAGPGLIGDPNAYGSGNSGQVSYRGNYQNVQPVSAPQAPTADRVQPANINQNPAGYVPPSSDAPLPSMESDSDGDVPELL